MRLFCAKNSMLCGGFSDINYINKSDFLDRLPGLFGLAGCTVQKNIDESTSEVIYNSCKDIITPMEN